MQFCQCHWSALRKAVDDRGMSHLVARSGHEAIENEVASLEGRASVENWDPLMAAHWAIVNRVLERGGLAMLGDICPLCEVQKSFDWYAENNEPLHPYALDAQGWVDSCMDSMLRYAREQGLVPLPS